MSKTMKLKKGNSVYNLIKVYDDFVLYENIKTGSKECFSKLELGLIKETPRIKEANSIPKN